MRAQGVPDVHENLFHGTRRACALGEGHREGRNITTCSAASCSLCRIIQDSFDIKKSGSRHNWKRFVHQSFHPPVIDELTHKDSETASMFRRALQVRFNRFSRENLDPGM